MRGALESSLKGLSIGARIATNSFRRRKISPKAAEVKVFSTRNFFGSWFLICRPPLEAIPKYTGKYTLQLGVILYSARTVPRVPLRNFCMHGMD